MAYLYEKLSKQVLLNSDDSENENNNEKENDLVNNEAKSQSTATSGVSLKSGLRGNALSAALLASSDSEDDDEINSGKPMTNAYKLNGSGNQKSSAGIYSMKINQTKKNIKQSQNEFDKVDEKILKSKESQLKKKKASHHLGYKPIKTDDDDVKKNSSSSSINSYNSSNSSSSSSDDDDFGLDSKVPKKKNRQYIEIPADEPPSPPPPPCATFKTNQKRKSSNLITKQLKELESIKNQIQNKTEVNDVQNNSTTSISNIEDEIFNKICVKVSTKSGLQKWEVNKDDGFIKIYEKLAALENVKIENLVLMLKDKPISFSDTPASIGLKVYDIIDCGKSTKIFQERITIIEGDDNVEVPSNMIIVLLQTEEGRKSRIKFLINKDEKLGNVLKKYLEKRELGNEPDADLYILEIEGDRVKFDDTPNDLDLDGEEMFDVRKSKKGAMQQIAEKQKAYEFDDDILTV